MNINETVMKTKEIACPFLSCILEHFCDWKQEFFAVNISTKVQSCQHCRLVRASNPFPQPLCVVSIRRDQQFLLLQKVSPLEC